VADTPTLTPPPPLLPPPPSFVSGIHNCSGTSSAVVLH